MNYEARHLEEIVHKDCGHKDIHLSEVLDNSSRNEEMIFNNILTNEVIEVLKRLPEGQYKSYLLYHMEGYTQQEIATMLSTSQVQVSRNIKYATRHLKQYFEVA